MKIKHMNFAETILYADEVSRENFAIVRENLFRQSLHHKYFVLRGAV